MKELQLGSVVGEGIFIGYLMTACADEVTDFNLMYKVLGEASKDKILDFLKKNTEFRSLFFIEPDTLYTMPIEDVKPDRVIEDFNLENLSKRQFHWKNGLPVDLRKAHLYKSVDMYFDTIVNSYQYCEQAMNVINNSSDSVEGVYDAFRDDIVKSLDERGWYSLGTIGFLVKKRKNYVAMILQNRPDSEVLYHYFHSVKENKRVKKPDCLKELPMKCPVKVDEKDFKTFFCASFRLVAEIEDEMKRKI